MKEVKVKVNEREISIKGINVLQHYTIVADRIQNPDVPAWLIFLKHTVSKEDFEYLKTIDCDDKKITDKLIDGVGEVMGVFEEKKGIESGDFQKPV